VVRPKERFEACVLGGARDGEELRVIDPLLRLGHQGEAHYEFLARPAAPARARRVGQAWAIVTRMAR
jgi:hypothetical protein